MKLRINGDSVRIRLSQGEVNRVAAGERVSQSTTFLRNAVLVSAVELSDTASTPTALFDHAVLTVQLPRDQALRWAASDQVTIEATQSIDAERSLKILVEKDFKCLHIRVGDDEDAFPNPSATEST